MSSEKIWDAQEYQSRHAYVSKLGEGLLDLLSPRAGEQIVDLGCGPGQLTAQIAERGAKVIGIDASPEMIAQARANFPRIEFRIGDARDFQLESPVDAVFSNAALHWVKDAGSSIASIWHALKPGGRFVAEFGGHDNVRKLLSAVRDAGAQEMPWFFPSIGEYASLLEHQGFDVRSAELFDRPTPVEGEHGLEGWLEMFGAGLFSGFAESDRRAMEREIETRLRLEMYRDGTWILDYRRLRIRAVRP